MQKGHGRVEREAGHEKNPLGYRRDLRYAGYDRQSDRKAAMLTRRPTEPFISVQKSFEDYGKLSHKNIEDLQSGFREIKVTGEEGKEDPTDFVLWKPKKKGEPYWESPWCEGRPGWHIECSVMSKKIFGRQIDIHAGGEDLIFPSP